MSLQIDELRCGQVDKLTSLQVDKLTRVEAYNLFVQLYVSMLFLENVGLRMRHCNVAQGKTHACTSAKGQKPDRK